ncbi:MAG: LON peptidase substrate-binding domain-containing protein [Gammaproteobacteria bacterium]|nr:LON peptidase substrate-binding domain-containing protein [Gammaproteobacteria bacterium]
MANESRELPLFPLHTVLYPQGPLELRIFEPRYLDMVSECLRSDSPFGVCLIESGNEAGQPATPHTTGTLASIADWRRNDDGLLGISAVGGRRFSLLDSRVERDGLLRGTVRELDDEPAATLPEAYHYMREILTEVFERTGALYSGPRHLDDASWVGYRLAEILSLPLTRKQYFLELEDPLLRLTQLDEILRAMSESASQD